MDRGREQVDDERETLSRREEEIKLLLSCQGETFHRVGGIDVLSMKIVETFLVLLRFSLSSVVISSKKDAGVMVAIFIVRCHHLIRKKVEMNYMGG